MNHVHRETIQGSQILGLNNTGGHAHYFQRPHAQHHIVCLAKVICDCDLLAVLFGLCGFVVSKFNLCGYFRCDMCDLRQRWMHFYL